MAKNFNKGCGKVLSTDNNYDGKMVICGEYGDILCNECSSKTSNQNNNQRKKDDEVTLATEIIHPEPQSNTEEDNRKSVKTDVVDNHVDTDNLTKTSNEASRIDGCRTNPQDDPGKASGADNGDTGDGTFPADSISKAEKMLSNFKIAGEIVLLEDSKLLEELGRL